MAGTARAVPAPITREEQQYVASQWKLVWWRFRRHRLAMVAAVVIAMFYLASIFAEFLTIHDPFDSDAKRSYLAPQPVHFFDGWQPTRPYVNGLRSARNPAHPRPGLRGRRVGEVPYPVSSPRASSTRCSA